MKKNSFSNSRHEKDIVKTEFPLKRIKSIWKQLLNIDWSSKDIYIKNKKIKIVNGDEAKTKFDMDFVEGGNHEAYNFIPEDELWIDFNIDKHEYPFIAMHEFIESTLILKHNFSYEVAHKFANFYEKLIRLKILSKADPPRI